MDAKFLNDDLPMRAEEVMWRDYMCHKKLYRYISLSLLLMVFFIAGCSQSFSMDQKAEEGTFDLTQLAIEDSLVRLDGKWEFYHEQLLEPQSFKQGEAQKSGYIDVPSSWNRYIINGQEVSGDNYATYRLLFHTEKNQRLGLKLPRIFTSYKLWVNGELMATAGEVGTSRETMTPQYHPQIALFESQEGGNEIVIQVANFYHRSGGILESLVLGKEKEIIALSYKNIAYDFLLFGSLIIIGIYHLVLYIFRKKNKPPLYFGLFCLIVGVRTLFVGESFFYYVFPGLSWEVAHKIQTLSFYFGVPLILMYFRSVFPKAFQVKVVRCVQVVAFIFASLVLFTPAKIFTAFNPLYQIFTIFVMGYVMYTFIKLFFQKQNGVGLIVTGGLALILTSLHDIVYLSVWMNDQASTFLREIFRTGNLSSAGQLIFALANAFVLARKFSNAHEQEEVMTAKLKEMNSNLDQLVNERTADLMKSNEKIECQKLELEKANQALRLLSLKDPLTDLWNKRYYEDTIEMEWKRCLRDKSPISLMVIDIDYFKSYNDFYGHRAGDECLVKVATGIRGHFQRASDSVVRYGGEEFVVIMPGVGNDGALIMARSLRKTIEGLNVLHQRSSVCGVVTVSIGVTSATPDVNSSPKDLFLTADKALYEAKEMGRNCVVPGT